MIFRKPEINKSKKFYFALFFWAILLMAGAIFIIPKLSKETITQTLKVEKVYGAMQGGAACSSDAVCGADRRCFTLEQFACESNDQCSNCDSGHGYFCGNGDDYPGFCYYYTGAVQNQQPVVQRCGTCGDILGGGGGGEWSPQDCNDQMSPEPSYRFSIYNTAGVEKAFISAEGYLKILGDGAYGMSSIIFPSDEGETLNDDYISNYSCWEPPAGVFRINDSQGNPVAAFIECSWMDGNLILFLKSRDPISGHDFDEFTPCDYNSPEDEFHVLPNGNGFYCDSNPPNLVITNGPLGGLTSAWFDNTGVLHLKACYAHE
ncbi:MAG: hypothetical protein NTZ18_02975 [Candidatus Komeilibacteria bacterium]|nr:hypothetical protein [Candidatus Komeilibacteria bacterium]